MSGAPPRRSPWVRLMAVTASVVAVAAGLVGVAAHEQSASAASATQILKSFDAADIISDGVMFNPSTMSASAIQSFLNGKVPACAAGATCLKNYRQSTTTKAADPMCAKYTGARNETAATIISRVSKACGVNPQVLLVTLQKEQGLVLDSSPEYRQWRSATGYGCPDTAPCDSDYYGFFNQVYKAAWAFKRYTSPKGTEGAGWTKYNWFPVGKPSGVLFHPNPACGARTITIRNKATAVLYYFTPYQPNSAALAAGYGVGNGCSAYGNRNFFLYFTTWFGSTHYSVSGAIASRWRSLGGAHGSLGDPVRNAVRTSAAGGGSTQRFQGGTVFSSRSGTFVVAGAVLSKYSAFGGPAGRLGWPTGMSATRKSDGGGRVQAFQHGAMWTSGKYGTWPVTGSVYNEYRRAHLEGGSLGWPKGDPVVDAANGGGTWQRFADGGIAASRSAAERMTPAVLGKWLQRGGPGSSLGWPTRAATRVNAHGRTGTVQQFQKGRTIQLGAKLYTVTGALYADWAHHGGPQGALGWPTTAAHRLTAHGGGWYQRFAGGTVYWSEATGAHPVVGRELTKYLAVHGPEGPLGWPYARTRTSAGGGGHVTVLTGGRIYDSPAGTFRVTGAILDRYLAKAGPAGPLGWPRTAALRRDGVLVQRFVHGSITRDAAGHVSAHRS